MVSSLKKNNLKKKSSNPIANSSKPSQSGYDAEIVALDILKKNKFEIIFSPEKLKRDRASNGDDDLATKISKKHRLERMGYSEKILNPVVELGKRKIFGFCSHHEIKYESRPIPDWLKKIPVSTPKEVELLKKQFWDIECKHRELCDYEKKNRKLMLEIIGKSIIPRNVKKNLKERLNRESDPAWKSFWKVTVDKDNTFVDVFCKKNNRYYVVDVKFKNNTIRYEKNQFDITNFEALNYTKIVKNDKIGLLILIIVADEKKFRYALTEWSDFIINPKFNPHEKRTTKVKMKHLIPFEKLKKITLSKHLYLKYIHEKP